MKKIILVYEEKDKDKYTRLSKLLEQVFRNRELEMETMVIGDQLMQYYSNDLKKKNPDYICSLDLAGFELDILLSTPSYNILRAKQMHIVVDDRAMDLYGTKAFALNLFVFVPNDEKKWKDKYPHIPNLISYVSPIEKKETLEEIIDYVIKEAEGNSRS